MSSKTSWDWALLERRRAEDWLSFGTGIAASLFRGVLDRDIDLRLNHRVTALRGSAAGITGLVAESPEGRVEFDGTVILATGAHDWSRPFSERFTGIPPEDGGSVTPPTISGDAMALVAGFGGAAAALPAWAAPVLPGYLLPESAFPGDTGYRACFEHCLPHTFLVNRAGQRFCDDSFHSTIVAAALAEGPDGKPANLPIFMIWDADHHAKYGLGRTMPGGDYPAGLVAQAPTLTELAGQLGIDPAGLAATARRFAEMCAAGADSDFGRGDNLSVRRFRGDSRNQPNPNMAPVARAPFFGMRLRLLNTGIAAGGVQADGDGRVLRADGSALAGVYAIGEASARAAAGVGYNSGYSLSRAMAFGWLAACHAAGQGIAAAA